MANDRRLMLDAELRSLLGSSNVYFQPPKSVMLKYPCIVYSRSRKDVEYADNRVYTAVDRYTVSYITKDPDDSLPDTLLKHFEGIRSDRDYVSDNLYHNTFNLFY